MSVYNGEKYLRKCIDSILNQSFEGFEFIIVEDCSQDSTLEILKSYQDSRIKIIQKVENKGFKGFVENLNLGIIQAKGKYIARMDADDVAHPERLQKQYEFLEKNTDIFLVGTSANLIDEKNKNIGHFSAICREENLKKMMLKKNVIFHPTIMFRKEKNIFYRDKFWGCEDYDFYLRLYSENKKIVNLSDTLLDYRILNQSLSRAGNRFEKLIFLEKAKIFYKERTQLGEDSYEYFEPEKFKNILNLEEASAKNDLLFACHTALKMGDQKVLAQILEKMKKYNVSSKKYEILNLLPENLFFYFVKIYRNLP